MTRREVRFSVVHEPQDSGAGAQHHPASPDPYVSIRSIDGRHPYQDKVPEACVMYPVRKIRGANVFWFNFPLAKEMGLIPNDHPEEMSPVLRDALTDTFAIQIINEWDQQQRSPGYSPEDVKPYKYMATRYLQLQHANKRGRTSGDGRSIWNGVHSYRGKKWDVSSRGTGVTCLSPGAAEAQRPLRTGGRSFGYGCGRADVHELLGSAILSEIYHRNGIGTERTLLILEIGRGNGIGVRAAQNLIRPAHLFLWMKQGRRASLIRSVDYLIERQSGNGRWAIDPQSPQRHRAMLDRMVDGMARFTAKLEREYVFLWMDWDGDNLLADPGIIDYGSVRQFGLRHDRYRYEDVDRYSTNLNEQKTKARQIIQEFAQLVAFVESGVRYPLRDFRDSKACRDFDDIYRQSLRREFLRQVGISPKNIELFMHRHRRAVERCYRSFLNLEALKVSRGMGRVADGVNHPALLNMRKALTLMPDALSVRSGRERRERLRSLYRDCLSRWAGRRDRRLKRSIEIQFEQFALHFEKLERIALSLEGRKPSGQGRARHWKSVAGTLKKIHLPNRLTGNASEFIVARLLHHHRKGLSEADLRNAINLLIEHQAPVGGQRRGKMPLVDLSSPAGRLFSELLSYANSHCEDI